MIASDLLSRVHALGDEWGFRLTYLGRSAGWSVNVNNQRNWFPVYGANLAAAFEESLSRAEAFVKEGVR